MQRVIRRSELELEEISPSDAGSGRDARDALEDLDQLEFVEAGDISNANDKGNVSDEEVDFRLFAGPKATTTENEVAGHQRIRLRSPSVDISNPGFVRADRDPSYYFADSLSLSDKENLEASALSGPQIVELSKSYRPGSACSWKVLNLSASNHAKSLRDGSVSQFRKLVDDHEPQKRKRPGKKARVKVRIKQEQLKDQRLASQASAEAREAAEREKRTRRNREKKVKKKMRDKAKKVESTDKAISPPSTIDDH